MAQKTNADLLLRDRFYTAGRFQLPVLYRQEAALTEISLMGYHNTRPSDRANTHKTIHFFIDDSRFEAVYAHPQQYLRRLSQYRQVIAPDFSLYFEMPLALQIYQVFKNRWCSGINLLAMLTN